MEVVHSLFILIYFSDMSVLMNICQHLIVTNIILHFIFVPKVGGQRKKLRFCNTLQLVQDRSSGALSPIIFLYEYDVIFLYKYNVILYIGNMM